MSALIDLTNKRFGRLTVMSRGPNSNFNKPQWWCLCDCGKGVLVHGTSLTTRHTNSCGCLLIEVASARLIEIQRRNTGENHPAWNGGTSSKRQLTMSQPEYKQWRTEVFERDNYTCQKCGSRGGNLNAHHIEAFAGTPELRIEITNGVTLCARCHKDFHHQYGNICTREQLKSFIVGEI